MSWEEERVEGKDGQRKMKGGVRNEKGGKEVLEK